MITFIRSNMKQLIKFAANLLLIVTMTFLSCKKNSIVRSPAPQIPASSNHQPIAEAGEDHTIGLPVIPLILDGHFSRDLDGRISSYLWEQISGPNQSTIVNHNSVKTLVTNLITGTYSFKLTVTDNNGASANDDITIKVIDDTLSGKEFIFQSLTWHLESDPVDGDQIYFAVGYRPDLFYASERSIETYIQLDTSSVWINVLNGDIFPSPNGYGYHIAPIGDLYIFKMPPLNYQLVGTNVKAKVKFL
jgi:hypothetical protein